MAPLPAIEYDKLNGLSDRGAMTGEWLAYCQACSIPEFASVFNRASVKYDIVSGYLDDEEAWSEIGEWIDAAKVSYGMKNNRMGVLGNYYSGMVDVYSDLTLQSTVFGTHVEMLEMCELSELRKNTTKTEIEKKIAEFERVFVVDKSCLPEEIERAAHTSVAIDKLIEKHKLGSMAYYYSGISGNEYENIVTSVIAGNTLLTGKNIPIAGEYEVKNVQAMKIMSLLGAGGCFSEFYAMDFNDDVVMLGHDGPAHFIISEGRVRLVPLPVYHGKPGKGLSIQMSVKHGPVTLLSVVEGNDGLSFVIAEGESVSGPILNIGNVNSRYKFSVSAKEFIKKWSKAGPSHHCSIGIGHIGGIIKKYAFILGIPVNTIS
jgi:L-arabinose isomerase